MFFKNLMVYEIIVDMGLSNVDGVERLSKALAELAFTPCQPAQQRSVGWVPPLHAFGGEDMVMVGDGYIMFTMKLETKTVVAEVVSKKVNEKAAKIEAEECRRVNNKEKQQLKDEVLAELLPKAFPQSRFINGYISTKEHRLYLDVATDKAAEEFLALLRKTLATFPAALPYSQHQFSKTMTNWIEAQTPPDGFDLCRDGLLVDLDGGKVQLKNMDLISEPVIKYLNNSMAFKELSLCHHDTDLSVRLDDGLKIKRIIWPDKFKDENEGIDDDLARLDADFCLMTSSLHLLVNDVFTAMNIEAPERDEAVQKRFDKVKSY